MDICEISINHHRLYLSFVLLCGKGHPYLELRVGFMLPTQTVPTPTENGEFGASLVRYSIMAYFGVWKR